MTYILTLLPKGEGMWEKRRTKKENEQTAYGMERFLHATKDGKRLELGGCLPVALPSTDVLLASAYHLNQENSLVIPVAMKASK